MSWWCAEGMLCADGCMNTYDCTGACRRTTTQETTPPAASFKLYVRPCTPRGEIRSLDALAAITLCTDCPTPEACRTPRPFPYSQEETPTVPDTNPKAARAVADGKLRLELIETTLTHPVARVMAHGADKYGVRNWRTQPIFLRTYIAAYRRHVDAIANGEWLDPDSGQPHAAHVAACSQVLLDAKAFGTLNDDTDYAEGGVPGGVAANLQGGVKLTPEYLRGQDDLVEELRADAECPDGGPCRKDAGCVNYRRCIASEPYRVDCGGGVLTADMKADAPAHAEFFNYSHDCTTNPCQVGCCTDDAEPVAHGVSRPQPICGIDRQPCPLSRPCDRPCPAEGN